MLDRALKGGKGYWSWIVFLLFVIGVGFVTFLYQDRMGPIVTGLSRDVSWGLYIGQYAYFVGIAAGAVMVIMPLYLHNYKAFARISVLADFLGVAAIIMVGLFVFVDLGKVTRILNIAIFGQPKSILFWNMIILNGYMILCLLIGWNVLSAERKGLPHPKWVTFLIYLSIPWAFSIHTSTAFVFAGLPGRHFWLSAIMAPRFLSSAFCSGPAFLFITCMIMKKVSSFDPGDEQMKTLGGIIAYAFIINTFFFMVELFTAFYSSIPQAMDPFIYLFTGLHGHGGFVPWMWTYVFFTICALILLIIPSTRRNLETLTVACGAVLISTWIDKGLSMVPGGFIPDPFGKVFEYSPTAIEIIITIGIYAAGFFVITVLFKTAISIKKEIA
ncbi:MAG TPA: menaquinol oxidoreductase [Desulfobacterales bacterium]|nr:menaquinol oxidoreductase [Desulfobacterales bacterium]